MGYMFATGPCHACKRMINFSPSFVPSIRDERGVKQPVCRACIEAANPKRIENGLEPITIHPQAYEPEECI
jgi:hypothetical protein